VNQTPKNSSPTEPVAKTPLYGGGDKGVLLNPSKGEKVGRVTPCAPPRCRKNWGIEVVHGHGAHGVTRPTTILTRATRPQDALVFYVTRFLL